MGSRAPPAMAIINKADPVLVCRPNPYMANGKMAGHMREFARLNKERHQIEISRGKKITPQPKISPNKAQ